MLELSVELSAEAGAVRPLSRRGAFGAVLLASLAGALGCSGGGGGSAYSLSVDPAQLEFRAVPGDAVPGATNVVATFRGDGLLVGYPAGTPVPTWLSTPQLTSSTATTATISVRPNTTALATGDYTATLRFVTGKQDGSELVVKDVPVRYLVRQGLRAAPASLEFAEAESVAPQSQVVTLTSDFPTDAWSVSVEAAPGASTGWLVLPATSGAFQNGTAAVQVGAAVVPGGSYAATLVVKDGTGVTRARVPVSYQVTGKYDVEGNLAVAVGEGASLAELDVPLTLRTKLDAAAGAGYRWTLSSGAPWVTVTPTSGDLSADVPLLARLDPELLWALANGTHGATLSFQITAGAALSRDVSLVLDLGLHPAVLAPTSVTFTATAAVDPSDLTREIAIQTNLGEAFASHGAWQATTSAVWITASPASSAAAAAPLTLDLQPAALAGFADGTYPATVTIQPGDARVTPASVGATLDLRPASVAGITPYTAFLGQGGEVSLRGTNFGAGPTIPVTFGDQVVAGRVVGAGQVRVTAPPQASAGPVSVRVENTLGLVRGAAEQLVLPQPAYTALRIEVPAASFYGNLTTDPERQAVLLSGSGSNGFRRFRFQNDAWVEDATAITYARHAAVTADGKDLLTVASSIYGVLSVARLDPETLAVRDTATMPIYFDRYDYAAPFADGRTLVIETDQWATTTWYPGLTSGPYLAPYGPKMLVTRDRTRLLAYGTYEANVFTLESGASAFVGRAVAALPTSGRTWSVSGDGGRLVIGAAVYDAAFGALGTISLPVAAPDAVALSPDGRFAYVVHANAGGTAWVLSRADVSAGAGPYSTVAVTPAFDIPWTDRPEAMAVSEDGGTLFLLTNDKAGSGVRTFFYALPLP